MKKIKTYIIENSYSDFVIWRPFCIFGGHFDYAGAERFALDYYLFYSCQVTCFYGRKSTQKCLIWGCMIIFEYFGGHLGF